MPRQPLADTPGLPPYGQRSSERRKEQNRLAQRQLRERRQQQEAAQALKLHEQQNEIRRLNRVILELKSENLVLKNQGTSRRRQSVIPISSLSRGLILPHGTAPFSGSAGLNPSSKLWYGRHSIDCVSGQGDPLGTTYTSNPLSDPAQLKDWGSDDENGLKCSSNLSECTLNSTMVDYSRPLFFDHHMPDETLAPQPSAQDAGYFAHEESPGSERYAQKLPARVMLSPMSSSQSHSTTSWPSIPPSSNLPSADVVSDSPIKPFVTISSQAANVSPQLNSTTKTTNRVTTSINFSPIWPASSLAPNKNQESGNVEQLNSTGLSGLSDDFSSTNQSGGSSRSQPRKASTSGSDTSVTNSMISNSGHHTPLSNLDARSLQFAFCSQEMLSPQQPSRSPTALGSSPDSHMDRRLLRSTNSLICFRSPFATSPRAKRDETPSFRPLMGSEDTKIFNFNTSSPVLSHENSNCPIDLNEIWATDF